MVSNESIAMKNRHHVTSVAKTDKFSASDVAGSKHYTPSLPSAEEK